MSFTLKITLSERLSVQIGGKSRLQFRMPLHATFGHVMAKLRRIIRIEDTEALFLFLVLLDGTRRIPAMSQALSSCGMSIINCFITAENAFGAWAKMYVRSEIKQLGDRAFIASIVYSYYGLQHFTETKYCDSLQSAREWILRERCGRVLVEEIVCIPSEGSA